LLAFFFSFFFFLRILSVSGSLSGLRSPSDIHARLGLRLIVSGRVLMTRVLMRNEGCWRSHRKHLVNKRLEGVQTTLDVRKLAHECVVLGHQVRIDFLERLVLLHHFRHAIALKGEVHLGHRIVWVFLAILAVSNLGRSSPWGRSGVGRSGGLGLAHSLFLWLRFAGRSGGGCFRRRRCVGGSF